MTNNNANNNKEDQSNLKEYLFFGSLATLLLFYKKLTSDDIKKATYSKIFTASFGKKVHENCAEWIKEKWSNTLQDKSLFYDPVVIYHHKNKREIKYIFEPPKSYKKYFDISKLLLDTSDIAKMHNIETFAKSDAASADILINMWYIENIRDINEKTCSQSNTVSLSLDDDEKIDLGQSYSKRIMNRLSNDAAETFYTQCLIEDINPLTSQKHVYINIPEISDVHAPSAPPPPYDMLYGGCSTIHGSS